MCRPSVARGSLSWTVTALLADRKADLQSFHTLLVFPPGPGVNPLHGGLACLDSSECEHLGPWCASGRLMKRTVFNTQL